MAVDFHIYLDDPWRANQVVAESEASGSTANDITWIANGDQLCSGELGSHTPGTGNGFTVSNHNRLMFFLFFR